MDWLTEKRNGFKNTHAAVWHLSNAVSLGLHVFQGANDRYTVSQAGNWVPVLYCSLFTLVHKDLLEELELYLPGVLRPKPVLIVDRVKNEQNTAYFRIFIEAEITPDTIKTVDTSGMKIWSRGGAIFVSEALKIVLENDPLTGLTFSPDFWGWVG
ncbi:hypothetical protein ACTHGU_21350 [Chitinophagaceae bacterium MMS25-I14]